MLSDLKVHFGKLLKQYIRQSKVRQLDVAQALDLSPSAVSQMLSGRIIPHLKQLDTITQLLQLERPVCAELRDCLMRIRSGDEHLRSPLNDFIRSSRTRCGLSLKQLSAMTGIPEENLEMLETKLNVQPTPHEAVRLAAIFGCSVNELWQMQPEAQGENVYNSNDSSPRPAVVLREDRIPYSPSKNASVKVPVIRFEDLDNFNGCYDRLIDFAWRHMAEVCSGRKPGLVMIKAAGSDFNWSNLYEVCLTVAEAPQWMEGMTVLCYDGEKWRMGKAEKKYLKVRSLTGREVFQCGVFWLVKSLSFNSDLYENDDLLVTEKAVPCPEKDRSKNE